MRVVTTDAAPPRVEVPEVARTAKTDCRLIVLPNDGQRRSSRADRARTSSRRSAPG